MNKHGYYSVGKSYSSDDVLAKPLPKVEDPNRVLTVANAVKYAKAEISLQIQGPVPTEVFEERKRQCVGCEFRMVTDKIPDEIGFCRSCGCGVSERARLTVKLTMPKTSCPQGKWAAYVASDNRKTTVVAAIATKLKGAVQKVLDKLSGGQ